MPQGYRHVLFQLQLPCTPLQGFFGYSNSWVPLLLHHSWAPGIISYLALSTMRHYDNSPVFYFLYLYPLAKYKPFQGRKFYVLVTARFRAPRVNSLEILSVVFVEWMNKQMKLDSCHYFHSRCIDRIHFKSISSRVLHDLTLFSTSWKLCGRWNVKSLPFYP